MVRRDNVTNGNQMVCRDNVTNGDSRMSVSSRFPPRSSDSRRNAEFNYHSSNPVSQPNLVANMANCSIGNTPVRILSLVSVFILVLSGVHHTLTPLNFSLRRKGQTDLISSLRNNRMASKGMQMRWVSKSAWQTEWKYNMRENRWLYRKL